MNYASDDEVTEKFIEDCEAVDSDVLRSGYLIAELEGHLAKAAASAGLAAEALSHVGDAAERRKRLMALATTLRGGSDYIRYGKS